MPVARVHKSKDYTVMSNAHFREKKMSLKAKGLLSLMLSLPDDWDYSIAGLCTLSKDGKDSVMNALNELEEFGYLRRTKVLDEKKRFAGYDYDIYEFPISENPISEKPQEGNPYAENPNTENPPQLNTNQSFTNQSIPKDKKKVSKKGSFDELIENYSKGNEEITDLLQEWLKVRKAKRAAMTDRAIKMNIEKVDSLAKQSGMTVVEYLKEVICRGWAAFYPIANFSNGAGKNGKVYGATGVEINPNAVDDLAEVF